VGTAAIGIMVRGSRRTYERAREREQFIRDNHQHNGQFSDEWCASAVKQEMLGVTNVSDKPTQEDGGVLVARLWPEA